MPHVKKSLIALSCLEFVFVCPGLSPLAKVARFARNYYGWFPEHPILYHAPTFHMESMWNRFIPCGIHGIYMESTWNPHGICFTT